MNDPIEHSISNGGIRETNKPICHRNLRSDQSGDAAEAIVEDFEQILGVDSRDRVAHPVIQDHQIKLGQAGQ